MIEERIYRTQEAADYIKVALRDGRNFVQLLQDARRGRRAASIQPAYYDRKGRACYFERDLMAFIEEERKKARPPAPEFVTVEGASHLEIILKAKTLH